IDDHRVRRKALLLHRGRPDAGFDARPGLTARLRGQVELLAGDVASAHHGPDIVLVARPVVDAHQGARNGLKLVHAPRGLETLALLLVEGVLVLLHHAFGDGLEPGVDGGVNLEAAFEDRVLAVPGPAGRNGIALGYVAAHLLDEVP